MHFQASLIKASASLSPALNGPKLVLGLSLRRAIHKGLPDTILPAASCFSLLLQVEMGPAASEKSRPTDAPTAQGQQVISKQKGPVGKHSSTGKGRFTLFSGSHACTLSRRASSLEEGQGLGFPVEVG